MSSILIKQSAAFKGQESLRPLYNLRIYAMIAMDISREEVNDLCKPKTALH